MVKLTLIVASIIGIFLLDSPEIKVAGAMRNIMMKGDLSAKVDLDTLSKTHLYGLGPVANLKGEIMVLDGQVFSSENIDNQALNKKNNVSKAAMFVYCYVDKWKSKIVKANVGKYNELEKLVEESAKNEGIDLEKPFVFKVEAQPKILDYHIIDWKNGEKHTMENHKQFAFNGSVKESKFVLLGFYSNKHHSIFTHHSTNMHLHVLDEKTETVGHLENIGLNEDITIYFPQK
jgi:acetolactate decarboxylase